MASPTSQDPLTPPTPSTSEHTMSVTPKLRFCLKRKDEHYVPLVAVDELPSWIKLKGVPMNLRSTDAFDLGWVNCGYHPRTNDEYYQVELHGIPAHIQPCNVLKEHEADESSTSQNSSTDDGKVFMAPDKNGEGSKTSSDSVGKEKSHIKGIQVFPSSPGQCIILNLKQAKFAGLKMHPRVPVIKQGTSGTLGRKIYCSFWLRTGNCNYEQQGCKFLHEIPSDEKTRNMIGFRDCPDWWSVPPAQPKLVKEFQVDRTHQATWRRGMTQDDQSELPASLTHGHYCASSNIAAPVPHSDLVQRPSIIQAPIMAPTSTNGRASDARALDLHKLQAAQQAALFFPQQQYSQDLHQMQLNSLDGANGNTSFQPITPTHQRTARSQPLTNELFGNAKVMGTIERRSVPAAQPPISRPVLQDFETYLKGKDTTKPTKCTPGPNTTEAIPRTSTPADSNTTTSSHTMKANRNAFSINGSVHSTSQAGSAASSGTRKAASEIGANENLSSLMNGSIASPRVMHRRLFVPPGEPQYMPNPIAPGKARQRSHSNKRANGRGRGCGAGKAGQSARAPKAQVQAAQEEDLVSL